MTSPILIGIDGGGTKTRVLARRADETLLLLDRVYPETNYQSIGMAAVTDVFAHILEDLRPLLQVDRQSALAMGMAGIDRESDAELYRSMLRTLGYTGRIHACNDASTALYGAHNGAAGAIVICGTGSIAAGRTATGEEIRSGGWGALAGDEGSGYRLGIEGIAAVFRAYDGSAPQTDLTPALLNLYRKARVPDLLDVLAGEQGLPVRAVASAARPVLELMERDPVCREIVEGQVTALARMVGGLASRMGRSEFPLALMGGLLEHVPPYAALFREALGVHYPHIIITPPAGSAAEGALLLAWQLWAET